MNKSIILAIVLGTLSLQSCMKSRSQIKSEERASAPKTTARKANNIVLADTTVDETSFFINKVDDDEGLAYGSIFEFDNAQATEIKVIVPYNCIKYDYDAKAHYLLVKPFVKALQNTNDADNAYAYIERKELMGYDTQK